MSKKPTLKDIAKESNLSVATVSYVLNQVQNQSIPQETRRKVLEAAEKLKYVPNLAAKSLVKGSSKVMGILISRDGNEPCWKRQPQYAFIDELEGLLRKRGYHVMVSSVDTAYPNLDVIVERKWDGAFLLDVPEQSFYDISHRFTEGVPLVVIDSMIEDPLFHHVNHDYEAGFREAKAKAGHSPAEGEWFVVAEPYHSLGLSESIKRYAGVPDRYYHVMQSEAELERFLKRQPLGSGIVMNELIACIAAKYVAPSRLTVLCTSECESIVPREIRTVPLSGKAKRAFDQMMELKKEGGCKA